MTEQEIEQMFEKLRNGSELSGEELAKLSKNSKEASDMMKGLQKGLKSLGGHIGDLARGMNEGQQGASIYNKQITAAGNALGDFAGMFGVFGKVIGGVIKIFTKWGTESLALSDRLFTTYQAMSKIGQSTAYGMEDLRDSVNRLGYGLEQADLNNFAKLMAESSRELAMMSGSAANGRREFADFAGRMVKGKVGTQLMRMGFEVDDINRGIASYVKLQAQQGRVQTMTQQQLMDGSEKYLKTLDELSKLTGLQRDSIASQIQEDLREERYQGAIEARRARGENVDQLQANIAVLSQIAPEMAKQVKESIGGYITTEAAMKGVQSGMGNIANIMSGDLGYAMTEIGQQMRANRRNYADQAAQYGMAGKVMGNYNEMVMLSGYANLDYQAALEKLRKETGVQMDQAGTLVDDQVKLRQAQMNARDSVQNLISKGLNPLTSSAAGAARALDKIAGAPGKVLPMAQTPGGRYGQPGAGPSAAKLSPGELGTLSQKIIKAEGGSVGAKNPYSSAAGLGQITAGRYKDIVKNAQPGSSLSGTTFQQYRQDANLQQKALTAQIELVRQELANNQLSTTDAAVYMAHVFGIGGAKRVFGASDSTNLGKLFSFSVMNQNPSIFRGISTVGDLKQVISDKMGGTGYRLGGIARGPKSGYQTTLHGAEAVVPLPDGKTIPVKIMNDIGISGANLSNMRLTDAIGIKLLEMTGSTTKSLPDAIRDVMKESMESLKSNILGADGDSGQPISRKQMEDMLDLMRRQNSLGEKILQASRN
jgi:soluble cytochrome b562